MTCYCSMLLCASYGVIASILLRIAGRPTLSQWATGRSFSTVTGPLIGWEWDIEGEDILAKHRPAVFISNHQRYIYHLFNADLSEMDVFMLGRVSLF